MELPRVSTGKFRERLSFWLDNLPIQLTSNGTVVAVIHPPDYVQAPEPEQPEALPEADDRQKKIESLRSLIQAVEQKTTTPASLPVVEEVREYTEPTDAGEQTFRGTLADYIKKNGAKNGRIFWNKATPVKE